MKKFLGNGRAYRFSAIAAIACLCAGPAATQNPDLKATYGEKTLKAGFDPDPVKVKVEAGGPVETKLGGFTHWVAKEPDFRVNYTAGQFVLTIHATSKEDTTLLINTPDGKWIANDDRAPGDLDPLIRFEKPMSGRYEIWVGTLRKGITPPAKLYITELKDIVKDKD